MSNFYLSALAITYVFHFTDVLTLKMSSSHKDPNDCLATVSSGADTPFDFLFDFYGVLKLIDSTCAKLDEYSNF